MDEERHCSEVSMKTSVPVFYWGNSGGQSRFSFSIISRKTGLVTLCSDLVFTERQSEIALVKATSWLTYTFF